MNDNPFTPIDDYRTSTRLGKQTLGEHKQNLVCTSTHDKGAVASQETEPDLRGLPWGQGH